MGDEQRTARVRVWWDRTWPWNLGLERLMWGGGAGLMAVLVVIVVGFGHAHLTAGSVLWALAFVVVGGWGIGHWLQGRDHPPRIHVGWFPTIIAWVVVGALLRALYRAVLVPLFPDAFIHLGTTERLLLAPTVIALLMSLSGKLRLHLIISRLAVFLIAIGIATSDGSIEPSVRTGASASELARARETGDPIVLHDVATDPGESAPRPTADPRCEVKTVTDVRRTLLGLRGRKLHARFDVCWDGKGHVATVSTTQRLDRGDETGGARAIRPYDPTLFGIGFEPGDGQSSLATNGPNSEAGPGDGVTIRVRPSRRGDVVDVVTAYELLDARGPIGGIESDGPQGYGDANGGTDGGISQAIRWRRYPFDIVPGRAVDLVSAHLVQDEQEASIVRFTRSGRRILANDRGVPGGR